MASLLAEDTILASLSPSEFDPTVLAECVYRTWSENEEQGNGGAEKWTSLGPFRRLLVKRVTACWSHQTSKGHEWFPWTEDAVTQVYLRIRKMDKDRKTRLRREVLGR